MDDLWKDFNEAERAEQEQFERETRKAKKDEKAIARTAEAFGLTTEETVSALILAAESR